MIPVARRQQAWTHLALSDPSTGEPYVYRAKEAPHAEAAVESQPHA